MKAWVRRWLRRRHNNSSRPRTSWSEIARESYGQWGHA